MRLHSLSVTAFGPFGGTVRVDFDRLGADGLFLLHGQTGAGKTSILDAIAFALYGVLPGSRRESRRLLSDHAEPGVVPEVELEATLGGRRLTVRRRPEYLRPKKRGDGVTKQNAAATLTWSDGRGENLTRIDEIATEVERLLGMRVDQFFQVVLLPQGDFARFLRARNDERGALLEQLFDTDRFHDIEHWFQERRRESAAALAGRTASLDRLAAQLATAADVDAVLGAGGDDVVDWGSTLVVEAAEAHTRASDLLRTVREEHDQHRVAARAAHRRRDAYTRGIAARERLASFEAAGPQRRRDAVELDRARRAEVVRQRSDALDQERRRSRRAVAALGTCETAAAATEAAELLTALSWPPSASDAATLDEAVHRWSGECAVLDTVVDDVATTTAAAGERARVVARIDAAESDLQSQRRRLDEIPVERAALETSMRASVAAAAALDGIGARHRRAEDAVTARVELSAATTALAEAVRDADACRVRHLEAHESWLELREKRLDGMAAELAGQLVDGAPCVVCGAVDHPEPATIGPEHVSRRDEDVARARSTVAEDARAAADAEVRRRQVVVDEAAARCGDRSAAELAAELDSATTELESIRRVASDLPRIEGAVSMLDAELHRLREQCDRTSADIASDRARVESLDRLVADASARITAAVGGTSDLPAGAISDMPAGAISDMPAGAISQRRAALQTAIAAAVALRDARRDADSAERSVAALSADLLDCARQQNFDDLEDALGAVRDASRCKEMERTLLAAEREQAAHAAVLDEPEVAHALSEGPVDVGPLDDAESASALRLEEAVAAASGAERRHRTVQDLYAQLWSAADRLGPLRTEHLELEQLAEIVAGKGANTRKMSLRSYVLAARLEDVAAAASVRFRRMSEGRYEFVHSDGIGPRGTRGGLGLEVRDDFTGVVRAAGTLSGGEAFCASLALALGLADVVAAEAGGVTLDTMFIDEGFGSLDSGSLDAVMGVLDELRSGGRTVGIVSHVDEIRDRVPSRLEVIRGREGSSLRVHAAV